MLFGSHLHLGVRRPRFISDNACSGVFQNEHGSENGYLLFDAPVHFLRHRGHVETNMNTLVFGPMIPTVQ